MKTLQSYIKSGVLWTFIDQSIVSGSSLVMSILLVSFLGIEGFGVYSLYWMAVLLIAGFHQALIVMPLYTLYPKMENLGRYISELLIEQLLFSLMSFLLIVVTFFVVHLSVDGVDMMHGVLMGLIAGTFTFQDVLRRILFVKSQSFAVVIIDIISVGALPLILILVNVFFAFSLTNVLLLTLLLKMCSILVGLYFVSPKLVLGKSSTPVRVQHWESGKYLLASSILQWFSGNAFVLVSGMLLGPVSIGVLRIAQSILGVMNVFFLFLENRVPIMAAKILHEKGEQDFNRYMIGESKRYLVLLFLALLSLGLFHQSITELFYGDAMKNFQWLIPAYCILYVLIYAGTMLRFTFRTLDKNKILFYGYVVSAIVGLSCVYPMIKWWGLFGAVFGLFATQIATIATYTFHLNKNYDTI